MTIDRPAAVNTPIEYLNGDTATLPHSYTLLSQLPVFLRSGADAHSSKFYNIPASDDAPFPALPINFPKLAIYLVSALKRARSAQGNSPNGVRRLAQYVDQFYRNDLTTRHFWSRGPASVSQESHGYMQQTSESVGWGMSL